jgi:hypothetical protein
MNEAIETFFAGCLYASLMLSLCAMPPALALAVARFLWEFAPLLAVMIARASSSSSSSPIQGEIVPPRKPGLPDGVTEADIINCTNRTTGRVWRAELCRRVGRKQGGTWYQALVHYLDAQGL